MSPTPDPYSLLWPSNHPTPSTSRLNPRAANDLSLDNTIAAFDRNRPIQDDLRQIIFNLTSDPVVIRYRQAILADIDTHPALFDAFSQVLPLINAIGAYRSSRDRRKLSLQEVAWRASELEYLLDSVTILQNTFTNLTAELNADGLKGLRKLINEVDQSEPFQRLKKELPEILPQLRANVSVTIGVNLDRKLRPVEATLVSINKQKFDSTPLLDRLLGRRDNQYHGIAPIHKAPVDIYSPSGSGSEYSRHSRNNPLLAPLFRDLADVLEKISKPISQALQHYVNLNGHFLSNLRQDISFYLAAVQLARRLREQDLPLCQPEIIDPHQPPICEIDQSYNLNLVHHFMTHHPGAQIANRVIQNDIRLNEYGAIQILTGPNQGGKTTYTQMVGINQILAQAGLYVPGTAARISPVDNIYTHYPVEEELELATGRFGDEAQRLAEIFAAATANSLILLNESLASTSPGESIYLAQDIVRILRRMGARSVFNTHLHELAASVDQLNQDTAGPSRIISMIASAQETADESGTIQRNYKIIPGPPLGHSYAKEIAHRYGISYEQLTDTLQNRGLLNDPTQD